MTNFERLEGEEDIAGVSDIALWKMPFSLCITNPRLDDNPIVYVNRNFEKTTGYSREAAIGRNCRFLQGEDTDPNAVRSIRDALSAGTEIKIDLLNYRADGTSFNNRLFLSPLRDEEGEISHFLGIQMVKDETETQNANRVDRLDRSLREIQHRVKNHLQLLLALIRLEAKRAPESQKTLDQLASRVEALNLLYDEFSRGGDGSERVGLGAYVSRVASALNMLDGQRRIIVNIEADPMPSSLDSASIVGLLLSELLTNALQHAFEEDQAGIIEVALTKQGHDAFCLSVTDNGNGLPKGSNWPKEGNLGARIVTDLVRQLAGKLRVTSDDEGTEVVAEFPNQSLQR